MNGEQRSIDLDWVETCDADVAAESGAILREVAQQLDLLQDRILVSAYSHAAPESLPIGSEEGWQRPRLAAIEMLRKRGVVRAYSGPYPIEGLGLAVQVDVEESTVRNVLRALEARGRLRAGVAPAPTPRERWEALPKVQRDAFPEPPKAEERPAPAPATPGHPAPESPRTRSVAGRWGAGSWWRNPIVAGTVSTVFGGLLLGWILKGCGWESVDTATRPPASVAPDTSSVVADSTRASAASLRRAVPQSVTPAVSEHAAASSTAGSGTLRHPGWSAPPYYALRFRKPRTDPIEFRLLGDSLVADAIFDRSDRTDQDWPVDGASTPLLRIGYHSTRLLFDRRLLSEALYVGQWINFEKDRAVFVLPKDSVIFRNLRLTPEVEYGGVHRLPWIAGRWIPKKGPSAWQFRLEFGKDGSVVKRAWVNDDDVIVP